jgi:hypothetical protein
MEGCRRGPVCCQWTFGQVKLQGGRVLHRECAQEASSRGRQAGYRRVGLCSAYRQRVDSHICTLSYAFVIVRTSYLWLETCNRNSLAVIHLIQLFNRTRLIYPHHPTQNLARAPAISLTLFSLFSFGLFSFPFFFSLPALASLAAPTSSDDCS